MKISSGWQQFGVIVFFSLYFVLGVLVFRDYGLTWDDPLARRIGLTTYDYLTGKSSEMLTYADRDYGPVFELALVVVEKLLKVESPQQIIFLRHFVIFVLVFVSSIFFYKLAFHRFGNRFFALLAPLLLILSPRIFADSFYNTKDMAPFAAMIIAIFAMVHFLDRPSFKRAIAHALASAFLVNVRLPGLIVIVLTTIFYLLDTFTKEKETRIKSLKFLGVYVGSFLGLMILFWPYLWINPAGHFFEAFANMSRFTRWDDTVLYLGTFVKAVRELPWHYAPVWIAITTPLSYLAFFLFGTGIILWRFIRHPLRFYLKWRDDLIFFTWFFVPIVSVIWLHSVLYDGWRHIYFIYPALILIALVGLEALWDWVKIIKQRRWIVLGALGVLVWINMSSVASFMVLYHPYQHLYFNILAGGMARAKKNFDLDYWGLTFKKGLEYIAATDKDEKISVFFSHGFQGNIDILPDSDRRRFVPQDKPEGAKYILTNYRWHPQEYGEELNRVYAVAVSGAVVMSVYKFY